MPDQKAIPAKDGRFMLVDYDDSVLEAVGTILSARGHRVQTARSIHEVGALIEKEDFDLIVADLHISDGTNGGGLSDWLARHKPSLGKILIWMCAVAPSEDAGENVAGKGRPVLHKPSNPTHLPPPPPPFPSPTVH